MAKQYYIKRDPSASGADIEWIAINLSLPPLERGGTLSTWTDS